MNAMDFPLHKQVLDTLPDGVTIQDRDFNIIYQNAAMKHAFGDQIGAKCYIAYEERDQVCEDCGILKVFETGEPTLVHRTAVTKIRQVSHWENSCFPLFDAAGRKSPFPQLTPLPETRTNRP
ncbi:MAG: PAS domain-containing protein [Desulfuromonadaceae bacterium]